MTHHAAWYWHKHLTQKLNQITDPVRCCIHICSSQAIILLNLKFSIQETIIQNFNMRIKTPIPSHLRLASHNQVGHWPYSKTAHTITPCTYGPWSNTNHTWASHTLSTTITMVMTTLQSNATPHLKINISLLYNYNLRAWNIRNFTHNDQPLSSTHLIFCPLLL
jgi:hypothetical protein